MCACVHSFDDLGCLGESCSLSELTLDGNPVAQETWYKQATLRCLLQLRQLDMKRITVRLPCLSVAVVGTAKYTRLERETLNVFPTDSVPQMTDIRPDVVQDFSGSW